MFMKVCIFLMPWWIEICLECIYFCCVQRVNSYSSKIYPLFFTNLHHPPWSFLIICITNKSLTQLSIFSLFVMTKILKSQFNLFYSISQLFQWSGKRTVGKAVNPEVGCGQELLARMLTNVCLYYAC